MLNNNLANKEIQPLNVILASSNYTINNKWAYRIGRLVYYNVTFTTNINITTEIPLFSLVNGTGEAIVPSADQTISTHNQKGTLFVNYSTPNLLNAWALSSGKYWAKSSVPINANSIISAFGVLICD